MTATGTSTANSIAATSALITSSVGGLKASSLGVFSSRIQMVIAIARDVTSTGIVTFIAGSGDLEVR